MNLFRYDSALKYGPMHVYCAQLNSICLSWQTSHVQIFEMQNVQGIKLHGPTTQGHGTHKRKIIQPKKKNE
jgi:hypothetical protein